MKTIKLIVALTLLSSLAMISCKKDSNEPEKARLNIQFDFNVAGNALEFDKLYEINGATVSFEAANFYMGGISFTQDNNQIIELTDQYLLAGIGNIASLNSAVDVSDINNIKFFIGVDPVTNAQTEMDFTSRPASDPLSIKDPSMHWSWSTGYKFLRVDGKVDTDGDGVVETPIAYHLGSDSMLKNFDIPTGKTLKSGENNLVFAFDLASFFNGVDLKTEIDTHTGNNLPLAEKLRDNLGSAISIE